MKKIYILLFMITFFGGNQSFAQTLIASSLTYCAGGTGVTFGVDNTVMGDSYTLQKQSGTWLDVDIIPNATGGTDYFPLPELAGTYRLKNTVTMIGITQINLPENLYNITVSVASGGKLTATGAGYCSGTAQYPSIGLSGSQPFNTSGVIYKLYKDGSWYNNLQHNGTGAAFSFGPIPDAGIYTIKAERNGCPRDMNGSKTITIFTLPTVSFTPTYLGPPDQCGQVLFTPNISYSPPPSPLPTPYSYNWSFGPTSNPPTSTLQNPSCRFPAYGTGTQLFPVFLQIFDNNGCMDTNTSNISVQQRPNALVEPLNLLWKNCNPDPNAIFLVTIVNKSTTSSTNTGYLIYWNDPDYPQPPDGDPYTPSQFPFNGQIPHTYIRKGTFNLKVTAIGPSTPGCNDTKFYPVFNGSTPTGGLQYTLGSLQGCKPHSITFFLTKHAVSNAPTTFYYFNFGDGTDTSFYQENMPPMEPDSTFPIHHTYDSASCAAPGHSFTLKSYIKNPCDSIQNDVGGIKISEKSTSDFLRTEFPTDPIYVCAGVPKVYTNNTKLGCIIYAGTVYNTTNYYWDFNNDGIFEVQGLSPTYTFPDPGLYPVKLRSFTGEAIPGNCGNSDTVRMVCVQAAPLVNFTISLDTLCINTPITPVNLSSSTPSCSVPQYQWTVSPNSGFTFTGNTNQNSIAPTFNFNTCGQYVITLTVKVYSGAQVCNSASHQDTLIIIGPPVVTINPPSGAPPYCTNGTYTFTMSVNNCFGNLVPGSQHWIVDGGAPIPGNVPLVLTGLSPTNHTIVADAQNQCGTGTSQTLTFTVYDIPVATANPTTQTFCSGGTVHIVLTSAPANASFTWTATASSPSVTGDSSGSGNVINQVLSNSGPSAGSVTYHIMPSLGGCIGTPIDVIVYVNPAPSITTNPVGNQSKCSGDPLSIVLIPSFPVPCDSISWSVTGSTGISGYSNGKGCTINQTLINSNLDCSQGTVTYIIQAHSNGCPGPVITRVITVNHLPNLTTVPLNTQICSQESTNITLTSCVAGTTFTWTASILSNPTGGTITGFSNCSSNCGASINHTLNNTGTSPGVIRYIITPSGPAPTNCAGISYNFDVTVNPRPTPTITGNFNVGVGVPINYLTESGKTQYAWTVSPGGTINSGLGTNSIIVTWNSSGTQWICVNYVNEFGCNALAASCHTVNVNPFPTVFNVKGGDTICEGDPCVNIWLDNSEVRVNYELYQNGGSMSPQVIRQGDGDSIIFGCFVQAGVYTVKGTNLTSGLSIWMNGQAVIVVNPKPISNYIIGSTGNCPGDIITLNGSQTGVVYDLYLVPTYTGISRNGPGPLDFGPQNDPGTYRIKATYPNTGCWVWINGSVLITPGPEQFNLNPEGPQCACDEFSLENSEPGILYILECYPLSGSTFTAGIYPAPPTGGPINFGSQCTPGTYKVHAYNPFTGCDVYMTDEKIIWANPISYNITPDPTIVHCGLTEIGLDNSQTGYIYYVYRIDPNTGAPYDLPDGNFLPPKTGTNGQSLDFGSTDIPWTYVIIGWDPNHICHTIMNGELIIQSGPTKYWMNPIDTLCMEQTIGKEIKLEHSYLGIDYTLTNGGQNWYRTGIGGSGPLSFGFITQTGTFHVTATDPSNNCTEVMLGSLTLELYPTKYTIHPVVESCPGVEVWLNGSQQQVTYFLHPPLGAPIPRTGGGGMLSWGLKYQPGTYYITAHSDTTSCADTMNGVAVINANPGVFDVMPTGAWCENQDIGMLNSEANTTYEIVHQDGSSLSSPVTKLILTPGSFWFNAPQPAGIYKVKATSAKGCDTLMRDSVIIDHRPTADAGPTDTTICNAPPYLVTLHGKATHCTSIKWTSPTNSSGSNFGNQFSLITTYTFTPQDILNKQVILTLNAYGSGGCTGTDSTDHITINIQAVTVNAGPDQSVCENEVVQLAGSVTGGTTTGIWSGGSGWFDPNDTALTAKYHPAVSETGTTITLTLTSTNVLLCPAVSDDMKITIFNHLTSGTASASQTTVCNMDSVTLTATVPTGGSGGFSYQWQDDNSSFWVNSGGTGSTSLSYNTGPLTVTKKYRLRQKDTICNPDQIVYTNEVTITVNNLTAGIIAKDTTICENGTASLTGTLPTADGTITYQWQFSTDNLIFNPVPTGGTLNDYTTDPLTIDTWFRRITKSTLNSILCFKISNVVKVTVNNLAAGTIAKDTTICENGTASLTGTLPTADGTITYEWQSSTDGSSFNNVNTAGTSQNYTTDPLTVDTWYRRITTSTLNTIACSKTSNVVKVTLNNLTAGTIAKDTTICENGTASLTGTLPTVDGTITYQWQSSTDGSSFNNVNTGGTSQNYTTDPLTADTWYRRISKSTLNSILCFKISNIVKVTVNNLTAGTIAMDTTICENGTASLTGTLPTADGTITYQWQSSTDGSSFNNVNTAGTSQDYTTNPLTVDTWYRRITKSILNPILCSKISNVVKVTVNNLTAGIIAKDTTFCENGIASLTGTLPTADGTITYQWQSSTDGSSFNDVIIAGTSQNYTTDPLTVDTWYRRLTKSTLNSILCSKASNIVKVTVNNLTTDTIAEDTTICYNSIALLTGTHPTADGTITYQWQSSTDGSSFNNVNPAGTSKDYTSDPLIVDTWYKRITTSTLNTIVCSKTSNIVKVTINPLPNPTVTGRSPNACINIPFTYSTQPGKTGYTWEVLPLNTYTFSYPQPGDGSSIEITWNTLGPKTIRVNYTDLNGCTGALPTTPLNVNVVSPPIPIITSGPVTPCVGLTGNYYTTLPGMTNYVWEKSAGGTITAGGDTASNTMTVTWNTSGPQWVRVNYTISGGCAGAIPTPQYMVYVMPLPTPSISGNNSICVGDPPVTYTTQGGMTVYNWGWPGGVRLAGGSTSDSSITVIWNTVGPPPPHNISVSYTNIYGCTSAVPTVYPVTVHPLPVPLLSGQDTVCDSTAGVVYSTTAGMNHYIWNVSAGGSVTAGGDSISNTVTVTWHSVGPQTVAVNYTNENGCKGATPTVFNVIVNPVPVPTITGPTTKCVFDTVIYYTQTGQNNYTWNISPGGIIVSGLTTNSVIVVWNAPGAQWIEVNYTNSYGCTALNPTRLNVTANPLPIPTITGDSSVCVFSTKTYITQAGMTSYTWVVTPGNNVSGAGTNSITVTWDSLGAQTISVNYTDSSGCRALTPTMQNVTVNNLPVPTITGPDTVCLDTNALHTYVTDNGMTFYNWVVSAGGRIITGGDTNAITVKWKLSGHQTISVNYTNQDSCSAAFPTVYNVMVNPTPVPVISGPTENICASKSGFTYYTETGQTDYIWNISTGGHITSGLTTNSVIVTWDTAGAQWISVSYKNTYGCSALTPTVLNVTVDALPVPIITGNAINCKDSTNNVYFTETLMSNYSWTVTGGLITSGGGPNDNTATVSWYTTGQQSISVNYQNAFGCWASEPTVLNVMVYPLPTPAFSYSEDNCNNTICFTDLSSPANGSNIKWEWDFGDGTQGVINRPPSQSGDTCHIYSSEGFYRVGLKVTNINGGCYDTTSMHIQKFPCIKAAYNYNITRCCARYNIAFYDSSITRNIITKWIWKWGDNSPDNVYTSFAATQNHTFAISDTFYVKLIIQATANGTLLSDTVTHKVVIYPTPLPAISSTGLCKDQVAYFSDASNYFGLDSTSSRMWYFNWPSLAPEDISSQKYASYVFSVARYDTVKLFVTNEFGCADSLSKRLKVHNLPVANFTDSLVCEFNPTYFFDKSVKAEGTINLWNWNFGDLSTNKDTALIKDPFYEYKKAGNYTVRLIITDKFGCLDTKDSIITVHPTPTSAFTFTDNYNGTPGKLLMDNISTGASAYFWDFGNGQTSSDENPIVTYSQDGTYIIKLITNNQFNCSDTTQYQYEVLFRGLFIPNAFAPSSTNMKVRLFKPVGINIKEYHIQVFDNWGHLMWESIRLDSQGKPQEGWDGTFNGQLMPQGVYIWKATAVFIDYTIWNGSDIGKGEYKTMGTVTLIR